MLIEFIPPAFDFSPSAKLFPTIAERTAWEALSQTLKVSLCQEGEQLLATSYPVLLASDFMSFSRTGNRTEYEQKFFARRTMLNTLVLAECIENQGRFLDKIIDGIFLICEESAWQLPAHNSYIRDTSQLILPDYEKPIIDLFAAETGAVLAMVSYLLAPVLSTISSFITKNIHKVITQRLITPYLTAHFWWMGDGHSTLNNWTAWCTQNILITALGLNLPPDRLTAVIRKACQSLDYFLDAYSEDGCCDEGAQYYRHAALCLFNAIELLNKVTNNHLIALYQNPKIRQMAAYILNAHISDQYYVNFADCSAVAGRCSAREYLFGKRIQHPDLMMFAAADYQKTLDPFLSAEQNLYYRLQTIFTYQEMNTYANQTQERAKTIKYPDLFYPSTGLFMVRDQTFYLAVKAGHNNDSHNHNDTGSFTIYKNGLPLIIDIGVESYTKQTFSPQRYEIWTMQSAYHNLPTFAGQMQTNGAEYKANLISWQLNDHSGSITLELAEAYQLPQVLSYQRTASLWKGQYILIEDYYQGTARPVVLSLMTCEKPTIQNHTLQIGNLGTCQLTGITDITIEPITITDPRLKKAWPDQIYRILLTLTKEKLTLLIH